MKKITYLLILIAMMWTSSVFAGVKPTTAWFNAETFSSYSTGSDLKTTFGITSSYVNNVQIPGTTPTTVSDVAGNVFSLNRNPATLTSFSESNTTLGGSNNAGNWTKTLSTAYSSQYFYFKSAVYFATTATYYQFKNSSGSEVFRITSNGSSGGPDLFYAVDGAGTRISTGLAKRAQWSDVEFVLDVVNKKLVNFKADNNFLATKTFSVSNVSLTNGTDIKTIYINGASYVLAGLDNTTIGELEPDNIKDITSNQTNHQTVDGSTINTSLTVTAFTNKMNADLPFATTNSSISWSVTDWGTMSPDDQLKVSLPPGSNTATATLSTSGATSADATITITASFNGTSLTKQITILGASLSGVQALLNAEMNTANTLRDAVTASNPYITGIKATLTSAISTANNVYLNSISASEINTATITLQTAETAFTDAMTPYNNYVTYIGTVTSGRDVEVRTAPFFIAIKIPLTIAINTATDAKSTVTSTGDISTAQSNLQVAYIQFTTDKVAYDNLNSQITTVTFRLTAVNLRKGDTRFLMFPTATVQILENAKTAAETSRDTDDTVEELNSANLALASALTAFNTAPRVGTGTSYYRIYTWGVNDGDGGSTKSILFASGTTLKYKTNLSLIDPNSIWEIVETTTNKYTIKNVATGNFLNGNSLSTSSTEFSLPEAKSLAGNITGPSEIYFIYNLLNSSSRYLEVDGTELFSLSSTTADRYRYCFQFEPINTLPVSTSGNMSSATNWSFGNAPVSEDFAVAGSLVVDQDAIGLSNVNVVAGGAISVDAGKKLTLSSALVNNGVLTLKSDDINGTATVITNGAVSGTGTTNVEQYLSGDGRQWWYLASPVSAASSSIFGSDKVGKHVEDYLNDGNTATNEPYYTSPFTEAEILTAGRGYVVKRAATTAATYNFTGGSLNTGDITFAPTRTGTTAGARGFNLVGNPYPSYIDWDLVYANAINMRNAIWFRTFSGGNMAFHTYGDGDGVPADLATGKIAPMQAFWLKVDLDNTGATLTFKNTHRKHFETGLSNPLKVKALDTRPHLRLVVSNGTATDETLIVGKSYASNELDSYDIEKMTNNNVAIPEIYSVVSNHDLVINSMNELTEGKSVPLGFRPGQTGNFTITATQLENIDTKVMLLDKQAVKEQELTAESPYSFTVTDAAPTNDRFVISFVSRVPTGVEINGKAGDLMVYSNINNRIQLIYRGELTERTAVSVYNVAGQMLSTQKLVKATNELSGTFNPGVYMIRVNDGNQSITKKLIIR